MKNNQDKYIEDICTGFQLKKGKAYCCAFPPIDVINIVYNIYYLFSKKNTKHNVFIVVDCYNTRKKIIDYFTTKNITKENGYNYTILSADYIKTKYIYRYDLIITVGVNDDSNIIRSLSYHTKFMLAIITKTSISSNFINDIRNILPEIRSKISENNIRNDNIYSPVEIYEHAIYLNEDDKKLYDKYTEYITTSISIFGDFDSIEKARIGDARINLSANEVRDMIARNNGWHSSLDTTQEFNKQIDDIYNPNALFERANTVYNIMRQRRKLIIDNKEKLPTILKICYENRDKRILIVSKGGEFASQITEYINSISVENSLACEDYHDAIESAPMLDDTGKDYIRYKNGDKKGEIKKFGSQALSNYNLALFNSNAINCLSIKSASDIKLKTAIDLIIFTSPFCDNIIDFKKRFSHVEFNNNPNIIHLIYCYATQESEKLYSKTNNSLFRVIDDNKEKNIVYNEDNNEIIL